MFFFVLVGLAALVAALLGRLGVPSLANRYAAMRWGLAAGLTFTGADHLVTPERYLPMMPDFVPMHSEVILFTGLCELAGALGILIPSLRRLAGIMLAVYFASVFPANIKNALDGLSVAGLPDAGWYYWFRLLFQPLIIWWALYATEIVRWPFGVGSQATDEDRCARQTGGNRGRGR
jgi:uncharacterized membrane protein